MPRRIKEILPIVLAVVLAVVAISFVGVTSWHEWYLARHPTCTATGFQNTYFCSFADECGRHTAGEAQEILRARGWHTNAAHLLPNLLEAKPDEKKRGIVAFSDALGVTHDWSLRRDDDHFAFDNGFMDDAYPNCYRYLVLGPDPRNRL